MNQFQLIGCGNGSGRCRQTSGDLTRTSRILVNPPTEKSATALPLQAEKRRRITTAEATYYLFRAVFAFFPRNCQCVSSNCRSANTMCDFQKRALPHKQCECVLGSTKFGSSSQRRGRLTVHTIQLSQNPRGKSGSKNPT